MSTITLQINDEKAYRLIEDLEALNIVTVIKKQNRASKSGKSKFVKPSKYAGRISKKTANRMIADLEKSRDEWERMF
ncbi:MAG: hypothetical protein QM640_01290 [Niabella sp.]